jgi:hypothetical protein
MGPEENFDYTPLATARRTMHINHHSVTKKTGFLPTSVQQKIQ